ncbi:MAG: hypothetical protein L3K16_06450 [Thermoplasmata archaeon]|nr:hypothetical protein [Thermoplasmata archaeon]
MAVALLLAVLMAVPVASFGASGPASGVASSARLTTPGIVPPNLGPTGPAHPAVGPSSPCDGPYPSFAGLGPFPAGCVGRDQAIAGFYSNVAGGGGNVSLQVTLPVDRSPTANQSDLYRAVWLGLVLTDPNAWMFQCFMEIRFQPDSSWNGTGGGVATSPNNWTGVVVGYETNPTTEAQQACFDQPLTSSGTGGGALTFSGGDVLNVSTVGWVGSTTGEQVTVDDSTSGETAQVRGIVDNGTPLDPTYSASNVPDALAEASAQVTPFSVGVELAGGANPSIPSNSSFGGCTPGVPPGTPNDPAVPCPSYDPTSWVDDTVAPLLVTAPVFSNGPVSQRTSELLVASTTGATAGIATLSNGTCNGKLGSAFCTYPWYSYSCGAGAFEFGATDYSGVTQDFGKEMQYSTVPGPGLLGDPQFGSSGYPIPACGTGAVNVTVGVSAGAGVVHLLAGNYTAPTPTLLPSGAYLISAIPAAGGYFDGWTTTGAVTVVGPASSTTTLVPNSGGTVVATFSTNPTPRTLAFTSAGGNGSLVVGAGVPGTTVGLPATVLAGGSLSLAPGVYPVQAAPAFGLRPLGWTLALGGRLLAPGDPASWLVVPVGPGSVNLTAAFGPATGNVTVIADTVGNGTIFLNGTPIAYNPATDSSSGSVTGGPGTYEAVAIPAPGWTFLGWNSAPGAVALPSGNDTNVTIVAGTGYLNGTFAALVTIDSSPPSDGRVSFGNAAPLANNTTLALIPGSYSVTAAPWGGEAFQQWTVSHASALSLSRPGFPISKLTVGGPGVLTAVYASSTNESMTIDLTPVNVGFVQFNFQNLTANTTVNASVVVTTYEFRVFPALGYRLESVNSSGPVAVAGNQVTVSGTGGVVTVKFAVKLYPVTFLATHPGSVSMTVNRAAVASGATLEMAFGLYNLTATVLGGNNSFLGWSSGLTVSNFSAAHGTALLHVDGPGSVVGIVATFVLAGLGVAPATVDVGTPAVVSVYENGSGILTFHYSGLPPGCPSMNRPQITCTPTASGTYPVHASVTDAGGAVGTTPNTLLTVVGDPAVSDFTVVPASTDVGVPVQFSTTPTLGLGPYSFAYAGLPSGCATVNLSSFACTPNAPGSGTFDVSVTVTDSLGRSAMESTTLTVHAAPAVASFVASRSTTDVGIATVLNATAIGGAAPLGYVYSGLPAGCSTSDLASLRCVPTTPGGSNVSVTVTDEFGRTATGTVAVAVNSRPSDAQLSFAPDSITFGQSTQVTASANGGTGGFHYTYQGLPAGCPSRNSSAFTCTPDVLGTFQVTVIITDALGVNDSTVASLGISPVPTTTSTPGGGALGGIDWAIVAVFVIVALLVAVVLVWRFGRPPEPAQPAVPPPAVD